jgi:hypothetical protein
MTRRLLTFTVAVTAALAPVTAADAATKKKKSSTAYPSVTKVSPLALGIGDTLTITGKNFVAGKNKNTIVFKRDGKKAIFVKAPNATKKKITLTVPEKLLTALGKKDGVVVPTKFRLRVLAKRFAKNYTAVKKSPTIAPKGKKLLAEEAKKAADAAAAAALVLATPAPPPPDCDGDGVADAADPHDDRDGLTDVTEEQIGTDRCKTDTDGDGLEDGWEYKSAFDLNRHSCPDSAYPVPCWPAYPADYPKKKPYPNPLDPSDAGTDHDGDSMTAAEEHEGWRRKVGVNRDMGQPLWYSDGLQASIDDPSTIGCTGMAVPPPLNGEVTGPQYRFYTLDGVDHADENIAPLGDGCLNDSERDEDGDLLRNFDEAHGPLSGPEWWAGVYKEPVYRIAFSGLDWLDPDTDGDGLIDGKDDQDHDDFWNLEEADLRIKQSVDKNGALTGGAQYGLWVDPFNPCLPATHSRTCPTVIPISGSVWRPFYRADEEPPKPRWPLYGRPFSAPEEWIGYGVGLAAAQIMPPPHPLPRCTGPLPGC